MSSVNQPLGLSNHNNLTKTHVAKAKHARVPASERMNVILETYLNHAKAKQVGESGLM